MYINSTGNVVCTCVAITKPIYKEESGEMRSELTYIIGKCRESSPEGTQTVTLDLNFYGNLAIPAMKIDAGQSLVIFGRERSEEKMVFGKYRLKRTVIVDCWLFRDIDPGGMLDELKMRREMALRDKEFRELFAQYLTECRPAIVKWVLEDAKTAKEQNMKKKEDETP